MPHPEIPVLDRGFVRLIDHMGTDLTVVNAARVSFGKRKESFNGKDAELVDYLAQHEHTAPFRHAYLTFHVKAPIFVFRQWMKHRIACLRGDTEITFVDCQGKATPKLRKTLDELWALWSTGQSNGSAPDAERVARVRVMAAEGHPDREIHRQTDVDRATVRKIREGRFNHQRSARNRVRKMNLRVLNERESTFEVGHIADIVQRGVQPVYRATLADGKTLTLTTNHRVLTEKGWTTFGEAVGLEHPEDGEPRITRTCRLVTNGAEAYRDAAWLRAQRELGRGLEEMAALAGCSTHTIRKWLKVHAPRTSPGTGPTSGASTPASRWSTGRASARTA
jgi:thymidylate synthase (FAD)